MAYLYGESIRFDWTYRDATGTLIDPASTKVKIMFYRAQSSAVVDTYTYPTDGVIVRDGVGLYHVYYLPNAHGDWTARVEKADTNQDAFEQAFTVALSKFYPNN